MTIKEKIKHLKEAKRYSIPAKRLKEHLKPILSRSKELKKRWMWELLQNASDLGDDIKVEFELKKDKFIFRHNGPPFSLEEAYNLIMPDSGKDEEDAKKENSIIGQFGTGFISTHILSGYIEVKGVVDDDGFYKFSFALDRAERENKKALIKGIVEAEEEYETGLIPFPEYELGEEMDTEFVYHFDSTYESIDGLEVIKKGMKYFDDIIPFVFAFRPQLTEIKIIDKRENIATVRTYSWSAIDNEIDELKLVRIKCKGKDGTKEIKKVGLIEEGKTTIAFLLQQEAEEKYRLLAFPENCPRLFCAFPMVGSEDFTFPVVLHSEKFVPNRERDGIELSEHDKKNRKRLIEARNAFYKLTKIAAKEEWLDVYHICRVDLPELKDKIIKKWLQEDIYENLAMVIEFRKIIELDRTIELKEYRTSLSDAYIPFADRRLSNNKEIVKKISAFAIQLIPSKIPSEEDCLSWYEHLNFDYFKDQKLDFQELLNIISSKTTSLADFEVKYNFNEQDAIDFLLNLVKFAKEIDEIKIFEKYPLIPNQNGDFTLLNKLSLDNIYHDSMKKGYNEKLKNIYAALNPKKDYRNKLLHTDFHGIDGLIDKSKELKLKDLASDLDNAMIDYEGESQQEDFLQPLQKLFKWYAKCGLPEKKLLSLFPRFSEKRPQLYMETQTAEQRDSVFNILRSGKSEGLEALANSKLSNEDLQVIANNEQHVSSFFNWLNKKVADNPDKELGNIGEAYIHQLLEKIFGADNVDYVDAPEYDFKIYHPDKSVRYYIDAKTTGNGIANSDNVPFFMRNRQWRFLENEEAKKKYLISRVFKNGTSFDVKFLNILLEEQLG